MTEVIVDGEKYSKIATGNKVIVRSAKAGVFAGELIERNGEVVKLNNCKRLWRWDSNFTLSELSTVGVRHASNCKFSCITENHIVLDVCEIIPCTDQAYKSIFDVETYVAT